MTEAKPVELRLKKKYLVGGTRGYGRNHGGNNKKATPHRELTPAEIALHAAQPKRVMYLMPNGKIKMITVRR